MKLLRLIQLYTLCILWQIERIENHDLWQSYMVLKDAMLRNNPGVRVERLLWHGTDKHALGNICKDGFNRSYCGLNGTYTFYSDRFLMHNTCY